MPTILIIEDEPKLARVVQSYLEKAGMTVRVEGRGDRGLSAWQQMQPDLVLLDLNLPGMDGLDAAKEIRRKADTPIIMVTARAEEYDRLIGLELGNDELGTLGQAFNPMAALLEQANQARKAMTATYLPQTGPRGERSSHECYLWVFTKPQQRCTISRLEQIC